VKFHELKKHITAGELKPVYALYGDDAWVLGAAWKMFDSIITELPEFNIEKFGEKSGPGKALDACETLPTFGNNRLIKADMPQVDISRLTKYLSSPNPSSVLVLRFGVTMPEKLKDMAGIEVINCDRLDTATIIKWAKRESGKYGAELSDKAAAKLAAFCLNSMARIATETLKLAAYKFGGVIEESDVEELVTADAEYKIFALTDALVAGNRDLAYAVLDKLIAERNQPVALLGLMYSNYRRLLHSRLAGQDPDLPKYLGVKDGAVRIAARQSQRYGKRKLYDTAKLFHKADLDFKSGGISGRAGLEKLMWQICGENNG